jgi:hypothetical protein
MLEEQAQAAISNLIQDLVNTETFPEAFVNLFRTIAYRFENQLRKYQAQMRDALQEFQSQVLEARQVTRTEMSAAMETAFDDALRIKCRGKTKEQMLCLEDYAGNNALAIIEQTDKAVHTKLDDANRRLKQRMAKLRPALYKVIENHSKRLVEELSSQKHTHDVSAPAQSQTIKAVKSSLQDDLGGWKSLWDDLKQKIPNIGFQLIEKRTALKILAELEREAQKDRGADQDEGRPPRKKPGPKPGSKRASKPDTTKTASKRTKLDSEPVIKEEPTDFQETKTNGLL